MTATPRRSTKITRIARLLGVPPEEIHGLDEMPEDDLRTLQDLIADAIFARYRRQFGRVAGLSQALPGPLAAKLAERFLPAPLAARVAELLEPGKAGELVGRLSIGYLADVAVSLDPSRARAVVAVIPPERVARIGHTLCGRGEYAAMAEFASAVTDEALVAVLEVASGRDLLQIAPLMSWSHHLEHLVDGVPDDKIDDILRAAADGQLWDESSYLLERLGPRARQRAVLRAAAAPDSLLDAFRAAEEAGHLGTSASELLRDARRRRTASGEPAVG